MSLPSPTPALVDFVLRHVDIAYKGSSCQRTESGYTLEPRRVPDYNLIFVTRGTAVWVMDEQPHDLPPGRLIVVPPGVPHRGFSRTKRVTLLSLHITAMLPGGRDAFDVLIPPLVQTVEPHSPLDRYLRGALVEFDGEQARSQHVMPGWCRLVAAELLSDNAQRGLLTCRDIDPLVAAVLDELARRLDQPTTLEDLAAFTGYSGQHVNRAFKKSLGVTPLQYLMQMRIARAGELLLEGKLTVRAVGEAVGFDDPYYFSRAFKQHVGHSPREHRARRDSDSPS